jgi:hypothetical protein
MVFHTYDSRRTAGYGFPDLVVSGLNATVFIELKSYAGKLSSKQHEWKWRLLASGQAWYCWNPADWDDGTIERILGTL